MTMAENEQNKIVKESANGEIEKAQAELSLAEKTVQSTITALNAFNKKSEVFAESCKRIYYIGGAISIVFAIAIAVYKIILPNWDAAIYVFAALQPAILWRYAERKWKIKTGEYIIMYSPTVALGWGIALMFAIAGFRSHITVYALIPTVSFLLAVWGWLYFIFTQIVMYMLRNKARATMAFQVANLARHCFALDKMLVDLLAIVFHPNFDKVRPGFVSVLESMQKKIPEIHEQGNIAMNIYLKYFGDDWGVPIVAAPPQAEDSTNRIAQ
jgi:hypothetical protein